MRYQVLPLGRFRRRHTLFSADLQYKLIVVVKKFDGGNRVALVRLSHHPALGKTAGIDVKVYILAKDIEPASMFADFSNRCAVKLHAALVADGEGER